MRNSLHSSLQNQIWLTSVMVKKQGPSQSSFTSYRKLAGHQRVHQGRVSTLHVKKATADSLCSRSQRHSWHKAIKSNTTRANWKHAGRELQGKVLTATAYGCSLASWTLQQRRSIANLIPTFGFQYCAHPECKGRYCHTCSNTSERHQLASKYGRYLRVFLCFVSV